MGGHLPRFLSEVWVRSASVAPCRSPW